MKIFNFKKIGGFSLSLAVIFSFHSALAQENGIPENLAPLARELGCETKEECAKAFDSNFEKGIELAEKYQVYGKEQSDMAKSYKQEVISKLSGLSEENFEEEIVKIAKELLKKPKLAQSFQLDKDSVTAAETIVAEVKNAGMDVDICSQSAETLSREQLIGCLEASKKLVKKTSVQRYIPKGVIEKNNMADMAAGLDEALARGDYPELGKTAEEAGQKCLRPGSESLKSCDEIAQKFFGPEGVKELAATRIQTKQAGDFYLKNLKNLELIAPDGRKITGKTAIKNTCDKAFEARDIKLARACGDFAVKNGFTGKEEMEESLKLFESMADKNINFDDCRSNPEICEEFIPEEHRKEFEGNKKIYEIMKAEAGFNPIECERGNVDFEIGRKCFEASKKALPRLKEIAKEYPEAQRMVSEIEFSVKREGEQNQRQKEFSTVFQNQSGPGGCGSEKECFAYCNDPAHGAECISFGAKQNIFEGNEAVERYQKYNDILTNPSNYNQTGQYGDNRFNQAGQNTSGQIFYPANDNRGGYVNPVGFGGPIGPSPECFAAIQSGDFAKAKEICNIPANPYQYQQQIPYQVSQDDRYYSDRPCSAVATAQCPEGQYREQKFTDGCPVYGQCLPIPNYQKSSAPINKICPAKPEFNCPSGYQKIYKTTPDGCGVSECVSVSNSSYPSYGEKEKCYGSGGFWTGNYCDYQNRNSSSYSSYGNANYSSYSYSSYAYTGSCPSDMLNLLGTGCHYMYNDSSGRTVYCNGEMTKSAKVGDSTATNGCQSGGGYSSYGSYSSGGSYSSYNYPQCDWSTQYLKNSTQSCMPKTDCYNTANADYNSSECQGVRGSSSGYSSSYGGSYSSYNSYSSYPSSSYSSYSPTSSASYSSYDASATCSQAGGSWDGATCVMPGVTTFNNRGGGLVASLGEVLKGILRIFSK